MISAYGIVRHVMMTFNIIFLMCGIGVFLTGIIIRVDREDRLFYLDVCDKFEYHSVSYITIASGLFIIALSAIGIYGTFKENRSILLTFVFCLFALFLLQVIGSVLTVVYKSEIESEVKNCMNATLINYYSDKKLKSSWDKIQEKWSCCGVLEAKDYEYVVARPFNLTAPNSCGSNTKQGCHSKLKDTARNELSVLATIGGLVTFVELLGIAISLWIVCKISEKYHT